MTSSDDSSRLLVLDHQSSPNASIVYSETDSSQSRNISTHTGYRSSLNNAPVIDLNQITTTLDSPLAWNSNVPTSRLVENNSLNTDLTHNPRLPHPCTTTSSHRHFQALPSIPSCIPNHQNAKRNVSPLIHTSDTRNSIPSIQSDRLTVHQANHQVENVSSVQPQVATSSNSNPPLKKNGKPLAQCPYCGMTFKKLEHCQRHERTHTLARPYPCAVCSKTFARQDTLNRHLRLHSRSEGRVTADKSSCQSQETLAPASSPGPLKSPPPRERGLSLSALEHSSIPGHSWDVAMIGSGPRQSISLPLQRPHQRHLPSSFQFNQNHVNPSHISSQLPRSSESFADEGAALPTEVRRGSWCPGVQHVNQFTTLSTNDLTPPRSIHKHSPLSLQRNLGLDHWESNLTTTFGLVETGFGPVPLSAPPTCTKWSALGIEFSGNGSSHALTSSSLIPARESFSQLDIQPHNKPNWPTLCRLEEEDLHKPELEQNNCTARSIILSSPSQPDSLEPNPMDPNCLIGPSTSMLGATEPEANTSVWTFPSGPLVQSSSQAPTFLHPTHAAHKDIVDCFGNPWDTPQKQTLEIFNPVMWHPPACHHGPSDEEKVLSQNGFSASNPVPINSTWQNNAWEEMFELGF